MRHFFVSEMDGRAEALARARGLGLELTGFCDPERLEDEAFICAQAARLEGLSGCAAHAPYYELAPCAIDPMIRAVALHRMRQTARVCARLGVKRMIVHSGYAPRVYFPEWFVPKSIAFWREFVAELPEDFEVMVENVLDPGPEPLRAVCDGVSDARLGVCLDVGHANAYSRTPVEEWIAALGPRIGHVHLHNNFGARDEHATLGAGSMDMRRVLTKLNECAPEAVISIESVDAATCLRELTDGGYLE